MVDSFDGSRNVLVAEVHWLHPALVRGASPAWRWEGGTGGGTKSGGGSVLDWGEARGAVVGVVRGTGRGILEIPGDRESEQGDCDGEVGAFVGVSGTVVFGGDGSVCVWTDWVGGEVLVDVWTDLVVGGAVGKGWGYVDVDTDLVVGEALGGAWGSVDVETECVAGFGLVEVALVAVAVRGSLKAGKSRCRNR